MCPDMLECLVVGDEFLQNSPTVLRAIFSNGQQFLKFMLDSVESQDQFQWHGEEHMISSVQLARKLLREGRDPWTKRLVNNNVFR